MSAASAGLCVCECSAIAMDIGSTDGTSIATPCPSNCGCCRRSYPCSAQGAGADHGFAQQSSSAQQGQREAVDAARCGASTLCSSGWRRRQYSSSGRQCRSSRRQWSERQRQEAKALMAASAGRVAGMLHAFDTSHNWGSRKYYSEWLHSADQIEFQLGMACA